MATLSTAWGDGTSDAILVTFTGDVGSTVMTLSSAANKTGRQRERVIMLKSTAGVVLATLKVTQKARSRAFRLSYINSYK